MRIGFHILMMMVLVGAAATQGSSAKAATFRSHHAKRSSQSATQSVSWPTFVHPNAQGAPKIGNSSPADTGVEPRAHDSRMSDVKGQDSGSAPNNADLNDRGGKQRNMIRNVGTLKGDDSKGPSNHETIEKDRNSVENRARDVNAIDTRITVQSRRTNNKPDKLRDLKTKAIAPRGVQARRRTAPGTGDHVARNAIGLPMVRHQDVRGRDGETRRVVPISTSAAAGIDRNMPNRLAKADTSVAGQPSVIEPNAIPTAAPAAPNRGMINGTKVVRLGFAPAVIGGPTRTVAGISGNMFRPRY